MSLRECAVPRQRASDGGADPTGITGTASPSGRWPAVRRALREIALLALLYAGYSFGRLLASGDRVIASHHAGQLLRFEQFTGIDIEHSMVDWLAGSRAMDVVAAYWYASMHYLVTPLVLIALWHTAPGFYRHARRTIAAASGIALVGYVVYPVMPPRLWGGYADTLARTADWGWWGAHASAPRGLGHLTNELAAMPSLHVGWAVWSAWALSHVLRRRWQRRLVWAYPLTTSLVVVATGNHWVLDVVLGAAVIALAAVVTRGRSPRVRARQKPHQSEQVAATNPHHESTGQAVGVHQG